MNAKIKSLTSVGTAVLLLALIQCAKWSGCAWAAGTTPSWQELGPLNMPSYEPSQGRVNAVAFDPSDPNRFFVGAATGGVWRTTDGGVTYTPVTDQMPNLAVSSIVVDYATPSRIFVATGDADGNAGYSIGVWKSENGGATWSATGLSFPSTGFTQIYKLTQHPTQPATLFATTTTGLYTTIDGGTTWNNSLATHTLTDLEFKPGTPSVIYACGGSAGGGGLFRSSDNGATWNLITTGLPPNSGLGRMSIATTAAAPNTVYFLNQGSEKGLWRSQDSGLSFTQMSGSAAGSVYSGLSSYKCTLAAAPDVANEVYVAGTVPYKSIDGGATWTGIRDDAAFAMTCHVDFHTMEWRGTALYVGTDGGLHRTSNRGVNWTDLSARLGIAQLYAFSQAPSTGNLIYTGQQDDGLNRWNGNTWAHLQVGDWGRSVIHPLQSTTAYGFAQSSLYKTTNGWSSIQYLSISTTESGPFVNTALVMDPFVPETLYSGLRNVWKTTDSGSTWNKLSNFGLGVVSAIAVAPSNSAYIYATTSTGDLWVTQNGGGSWTNTRANGLPSSGGRALKQVAISPLIPGTAYVTTDGYGSGARVYRTSNAGGTWSDFSGTLPVVPVRSIAAADGTSAGVYAGTNLGVYYRNSTMPDWIPFNAGLPNAIISDLQIHGGTQKLRVGTYGRGLWESSTVEAPPIVSTGSVSSFIQAVAEGCDSLATVDATGYSVVATGNDGFGRPVFDSAPASFHLAVPPPNTPPTVTLKPDYVPANGGSMQFRSRFGLGAVTQTIHVQASIDGGGTWADLYTQNGTATIGETAFVTRTVSLDAYANANAVIRLRFRYDYDPGYGIYMDTFPGIGWYFDTITFTNTNQLIPSNPLATIVNGTVNPQGQATMAWFEYGTTTAYGSQTARQNVGEGTSVTPVSSTLTDLLPNTTYHYRFVSANADGTSRGLDRTFATSVTPTVRSLNIGQQSVGNIATPLALNQWNFSAIAGQQVQFDLVGSSSPGLAFRLTGPGSYVGFQDITGDSALINLPVSGSYTLSAYGLNGATGSYSFVMKQTTVTPLALGTPYNGTWAGSGQAQLFSVPVNATIPLSVVLSDLVAANHTEIYARFGAPPTREAYDYAANGSGSSHSLLVPSPTAGTWYVLVYGESIPSAAGSFTLQATSLDVVLTGNSTRTSGTNIATTLTLSGAGFNSGSQVSLVASNGTVYSATSSTTDLLTQITATFAAGSVPAGTYGIKVTQANGAAALLPGSLQIVQTGQAVLKTSIIVPSPIGRHMTATIYVNYANTGTVPMPAPLLTLTATNPAGQQGAFLTLDSSLISSGFWTSATPAGYSNAVHILASGATPGVLQPGESKRISVYYAGWLTSQWDFSNSKLNFSLATIKTTDTTAVNWASLEALMRPSTITNEAWHVMYGAMRTQLGTTAGGYIQLLDNAASYLGRLGQNVTDVGKLWGFTVAQTANNWPVPSLGGTVDVSLPMAGALSLSFGRTFNQSIPGRFRSGPLGRSWSTTWQQSLTVASDGTVTVNSGNGVLYTYQPDSRNPTKYFSQPGDLSVLTKIGGVHRRTVVDGSATFFNSNGTLNYLEDANGNRITAGYTGARLSILTASSGQSLSLGYNAGGLISNITDSTGSVTSYAYDGSNQHLMSVISYHGQITSYLYNQAPGAAAQNALTAITFPDGTHQYFTHDSQGRLAGTSAEGNTLVKTLAYLSGQVSITDAIGSTTSLYFDQNGQVARTVDALGNSTYFNHDNKFNLVNVTNASGAAASYTYDSAGKVTSAKDFLGNTTGTVHGGKNNQLSVLTDAKGNKTFYIYSTAGNLLTTTFANTKKESLTYGAQGNALSFVNAAGEAIQYAYNAAGQITSATIPDGSSFTYAYDSQGRMTSATDINGTVIFNYHPTTGFLTSVANPNGTSLTFSYDSAGRRISMVDQSGFTTNYNYDLLGRLTALKDGSNNMIVNYSYDVNGRLSQKTNGNGTSTTYQYDAAGKVQHLINRAPGGAVNSRFDDTYNGLGLKAAEVTLDGDWAYTYDANGQLIHAVFASNNLSSLPNQDLAYSYDALGNRISTVINGATFSYVTNNMNQYTSVGGTAYNYDAKGNLLSDGVNTYGYNVLNKLVSSANGGGTTTYTYDALGQRASSIEGGQTTKYQIDPSGLGNIVATSNAAGGFIAHYTYGIGLASLIPSVGAAEYFDFNPVGSTVGLSGVSGTYDNTYAYFPFGDIVHANESVANPFQFIGKLGVTHEMSGVESMRARNYNSSTGRFTSNDPIGLRGGSINLLAYAYNNPIQRTDPLGLSDWQAVGTGVVVTAVVAGGILYFGPAALIYVAGEGAISVAGALAIGAPGYLSNAEAINEAAVAGGSYVISALTDAAFTPSLEGGVGTGIPDLVATALDPAFWDALSDSMITLLDTDTSTVNATDPNAIYGPAGFGTSNFVRGTSGNFGYRITYENDSTATAPAQLVTVTQNLDAYLDWSSIEMTGVGFGDTILTIPPGSQYFTKTVSITYNNETFDVEVEAGVHTGNGQVYARFQSLNPATGLPPSNVLTGFLPSEDGTGRGQGFLTYTVAPKPNLPTSTEIRSVATIVFDAGESIKTNQIDPHDPSKGTSRVLEALVTIDADAPTSAMNPLPAVVAPTFPVSWSATDGAGGSGIGDYTVYVSTNGGAYAPWLSNTSATSGMYAGVADTTYSFYVVARDNAGNVQQVNPATASVSTLALVPQAIVVEQSAGTPLGSGTGTVNFGSSLVGAGAARTFIVRNTGAISLAISGVTFDGTNGTDFTLTTAPAATVAGSGNTTFAVTFKAGAIGSRTGALHIASNDPNTGSFTVNLTGTGLNNAPTISHIADLAIDEDHATGEIAFMVGDVETAAASLTVGGSSSNTVLVPNANIVFGGSGASRTLFVTPAADRHGTATIIVSANDGTTMSQIAFVLTVNAVNDVPTISDIANQTTGSGGTTGALAFTIGDVESPAASLTVSGTSNNVALIPNAKIVFGGSGADRTVRLTAAPNQSGTAVITVVVSDGDKTGSGTFEVTVNAPEIVVEQPSGTSLVDAGTKGFGNVVVGSSSVLKFAIRNTGSINLTGLAITKDGTDAANFTVTAPGKTLLTPGAATTFTVRFTPASTGSRLAVIRIASNDANENPFDITVTGKGVLVPEIAIQQPAGTNLKDGVSVISFGSVAVKFPVTKTFIIVNTGKANLKKLAVTKDGTNANNFTVTPPLKTALSPGASTTFKVTFKPSAAGNRSAAIHIANNDSDENPFDIALTGKGVVKPSALFPVRLPSWSDLNAFGAAPDPYGERPVFQIVTKVELADGRKYLLLVVQKSLEEFHLKRTAEVSPNLIDWYSGTKHTTVMEDDAWFLKVRDNTPLTPGTKRYIRLKPNR